MDLRAGRVIEASCTRLVRCRGDSWAQNPVIRFISGDSWATNINFSLVFADSHSLGSSGEGCVTRPRYGSCIRC